MLLLFQQCSFLLGSRLIAWPLLVCSLLLFGCSEHLSPTLRIGMNNWPGFAPLYLSSLQAQSREDLSYQLVPMASATDVMHGLRSGTLEAGALTLDEAITLASQGVALRIVMVFDISTGGDALLAHPEFNDLLQLTGKTIAVEPSGVGALVLSRALASVGLGRDDIRILNCDSQRHLPCFAIAEAVVTYEPMKSQLQDQGAINLFDSRQMPNEIVDVLVVSEPVYVSRKKQIKQLISQYYATRRQMLVNANDNIQPLVDFTGLAPATLQAAFQGIELPDQDQALQLMLGSPSPLQQQIDQLSQFLVAEGRIDNVTEMILTVDASNMGGRP